MDKKNQIKDFDNLCELHSCWIIQYKVLSSDKPVFMIWFTDREDKNQDKLVINSDQKIITAHNSLKLFKSAQKQDNQLSLQVKTWITESLKFKVDSKSIQTYNPNIIINNLQNQITDNYTLEKITNFINLYQDFGYQIDDEVFLSYSKTPPVKHAWHFYYNEIFWPKFHNDELAFKRTIPKFDGSDDQLMSDLYVMIQEFEKRININ